MQTCPWLHAWSLSPENAISLRIHRDRVLPRKDLRIVLCPFSALNDRQVVSPCGLGLMNEVDLVAFSCAVVEHVPSAPSKIEVYQVLKAPHDIDPTSRCDGIAKRPVHAVNLVVVPGTQRYRDRSGRNCCINSEMYCGTCPAVTILECVTF